jgi:hypothetical protein
MKTLLRDINAKFPRGLLGHPVVKRGCNAIFNQEIIFSTILINTLINVHDFHQLKADYFVII